MWRHARTGTRAAGSRVRGSNIGIGAVIDVEKCSLRAFEKNLFSALQCLMQINDGVGDERAQEFSGREIRFVHRFVVDRLRAERAQNAVIFLNLGFEFFRKQPRLHQVGNAQTGPRRLVAIGRADAAFRRSDFGHALAQFTLFIEHAMIRQHKMGAVTDEQIFVDRDAEHCADP